MKMNEMLQTIEELRSAAAAVIEAADWLAKQFGGISDEKAEAIAEAAKPVLKLEDVRAILAEKSRAGLTAQVRELLHKYGAAKLSEIDPAQYEALVREAEVLTDAT